MWLDNYVRDSHAPVDLGPMQCMSYYDAMGVFHWESPVTLDSEISLVTFDGFASLTTLYLITESFCKRHRIALQRRILSIDHSQREQLFSLKVSFFPPEVHVHVHVELEGSFKTVSLVGKSNNCQISYESSNDD